MNKPKKILFDLAIRERIFLDMKKLLQQIFNSDEIIKEISIFGSAQNKEFGKYVAIYKPETSTEREFSDIDCVFLLDKIKDKKIILKNGMFLEGGKFLLSKELKIVKVKNHPVMCAVLTSKEDFYNNINKQYPKGYDYVKSKLTLYKRQLKKNLSNLFQQSNPKLKWHYHPFLSFLQHMKNLLP